jgi:superfamily I DNA/RNA helicase
VKVGREGLEFKHVIVAPTRVPFVSEQPAAGNATEPVEMERRELYVAMTHARDGLGRRDRSIAPREP